MTRERFALGTVSIEEVRPFLVSNGLPADDLVEGTVELTGVRDSDELIGSVGIEVYGPSALIRSLAVREDHRSGGIGASLVESALARARELGVVDVYGVALTAPHYLARFGFKSTSRARLPAAIASASQRRVVCGDEAVVLHRSLRPVVMFLCVHNAGRSQMAAALLSRRAEGRVEVISAGSEPASAINPAVLEVMRELGSDLSGAVPTKMTLEHVREADVVVTMGCGDACPVFPGKRYVDWELPDPAGQPLAVVRSIRDEIARRIDGLVTELGLAACESRASGA